MRLNIVMKLRSVVPGGCSVLASARVEYTSMWVRELAATSIDSSLSKYDILITTSLVFMVAQLDAF